eukprot:3175463-Rhodomonas_salina.1
MGRLVPGTRRGVGVEAHLLLTVQETGVMDDVAGRRGNKKPDHGDAVSCVRTRHSVPDVWIQRESERASERAGIGTCVWCASIAAFCRPPAETESVYRCKASGASMYSASAPSHRTCACVPVRKKHADSFPRSFAHSVSNPCNVGPVPYESKPADVSCAKEESSANISAGDRFLN